MLQHQKQPDAQVSYTAKRGFHMLCQQPGAKGPDGQEGPALPRAFVEMERKGRGQVQAPLRCSLTLRLVEAVKQSCDDQGRSSDG